MQKTLSMIIIFVMYSCGGDEPTSPNETQYHSDDETFLSQLIETNGIERDTLINRITVESVEMPGGEYDRIIEMDLSGLELDNLPSTISDLEYLEELDLSNNYFSDLPEELCEVYNKGIVLNSTNNLLCDPTKITHCILNEIKVDFEKQSCSKVKYDQEMDFLLQFINENDLDSLSKTIFDNVTWAWVGTDSALTSDDKQIERITEIKWVNHGINSIPGTIQDLGFLVKLELEENELTTLPTELKSLINLEDLQLHDNKLVALPAFIGYLNKLVRLDIHNNSLKELPLSMEGLQNLNFLNVANNKLNILPESLCGLTTINSINLECNDLDATSIDVASCFHSYLGSQLNNDNCGGE